MKRRVASLFKNMFTNFKRILGFAINDFSRNKGISIATIFVLSITILLLSGLYFFHGAVNYFILHLQEKIDITAYFKADVAEQDILLVKEEIQKTSSFIKSVDYVSKEQALANFNQLYKDNDLLLNALEEVGDNPFLPALNITTDGDPNIYASIANMLQTSDISKIISKVDFSQKKDTIQKVYSLSKNINIFGIILEAFLLLVAILVVYNTIKLAIENSKEEIETMKVVGASDKFVRGPFVIQGIIYGIVSFFICFLIIGICAYFLSSKISVFLPGFDTFWFLLTNWWIFVLIQLGFGVAVGSLSAMVVVRKYLKV
jgi:cell division transport system permease protein